MNAESKDQEFGGDEFAYDKSLSDAMPDDEPVNDLARRLSAAREYQANALNKSDPGEAIFGAVNGGLVAVTFELEDMIGRTLAAGNRTVEDLKRMSHPLDVYLRAIRQIERFRQTELRAAEMQQTKEASMTSMQSFALQGLARGPMRRK
jgi:hypothetical protein